MSLSYPDPTLADDIVRLRQWSEHDLLCIEEAAQDSGIPEGTTVPAVFTVEAGRAFVRRQWSRIDNGEGVSLAIADNATDKAVGLAFLSLRPQAGVVGIGYWLIPRARGRGLATAAVKLLSSWAIDHAGIARVEAWVEQNNHASQRVLTAAGFQQEGLLRSFLSFANRRADALVFSRIDDDVSSRPAAHGVSVS